MEQKAQKPMNVTGRGSTATVGQQDEGNWRLVNAQLRSGTSGPYTTFTKLIVPKSSVECGRNKGLPTTIQPSSLQNQNCEVEGTLDYDSPTTTQTISKLRLSKEYCTLVTNSNCSSDQKKCTKHTAHGCVTE